MPRRVKAGFDRAELRRLNMVPADAMPMTNVFGFQVDSGTFAETLGMALARADLAGFAGRRRQSEARGRLRGLGFAYHIKGTGGPPEENVDIRFESDGTVSLITGTQHIGQGHETTFPQILAHRLGVANERIRLRQGDTDLIAHGGGHGSSRATYMGGTAIWRASDEIIAKGTGHRRRRAGGGRGRHPLRGRPLRRVGHRPRHRPARGRGARPRQGRAARHLSPLEARAHDLPQRRPCRRGRDRPRHRPRRPGALHGGRRLRRAGQPDDRRRPGAWRAWRRARARPCWSTRPTIPDRARCWPARSWTTPCRAPTTCRRSSSASTARRCTTNPLGVKGCGEAGAIAAFPAIANAILDALAPLGVKGFDGPATPARIWQAMQAAR